MSDQELLEKAAKAAGYTPVRMEDGSMLLCGIQEPWNPLTDDGDALRLAVKMRIDIDFDELEPRVEAYRKVLGAESVYCPDEYMEPDPNAAARRAIVRAAAELKDGE